MSSIPEADQSSTRPDDLEIIDTDEETKIREEIARDFTILISRIKTPFNNILTLRRRKILPYSREAAALNLRVHQTYFLLDEEEEQSFFQYITELNETLGAANSTLDSYIKFTKSSPDFEKFLNMFFIFVENYTAYRASFFFQTNAEKGNYLYPYFEVDNVLIKLQFLFARLCGTLSVGGRWTVIQPPSPPPSQVGDYIGEPHYPINDYEPWRMPYNEPKRKYRDIGDNYV